MHKNKIIKLALILIALLLFLGTLNAWGPAGLLLSTVVALIALKLLGWLGLRVQINIWSILIILLGGIIGLLLLIFLSAAGIAFNGKKKHS